MTSAHDQFIRPTKLPQPHQQTDEVANGIVCRLKFRGDELNVNHLGVGYFDCKCPICQADSKPIHIRPVEVHPIDARLKELQLNSGRMKEEKISQRNFLWLLEHLLPAQPDKFKGCEIVFPETVMFKGAKPKVMIKTDKDFCLSKTNNPEKLKLSTIQKEFTTIVTLRKKDKNGVFSQIYKKQFQIEAINKLNQETANEQQNQNNSTQNSGNGKNNQGANLFELEGLEKTKQSKQASAREKEAKAKHGQGNESLKDPELRNLEYRTVAIVRFFPEGTSNQDDGDIQQEDVQDCLDIWEADKFNANCGKPYGDSWKMVRMLQTVINSKQGTGKPITVDFYAPLPLPGQTEIKYDFRALGEEIGMITTGNDFKYCLKQCYKMCYYVQKIWNKEILKMRCEFAKDDNGTIWFTYATRIFVKDMAVDMQAEKRVKKVSYVNQEHQEILLRQLKEHRQKCLETGNQNIDKIQRSMQDKYDQVKRVLGLEQALADSTEDEENEYIKEKKRERALYKSRKKAQEKRLLKSSRSTVSNLALNHVIVPEKRQLGLQAAMQAQADKYAITSINTANGQMAARPDSGIGSHGGSTEQHTVPHFFSVDGQRQGNEQAVEPARIPLDQLRVVSEHIEGDPVTHGLGFRMTARISQQRKEPQLTAMRQGPRPLSTTNYRDFRKQPSRPQTAANYVKKQGVTHEKEPVLFAKRSSMNTAASTRNPQNMAETASGFTTVVRKRMHAHNQQKSFAFFSGDQFYQGAEKKSIMNESLASGGFSSAALNKSPANGDNRLPSRQHRMVAAQSAAFFGRSSNMNNRGLSSMSFSGQGGRGLASGLADASVDQFIESQEKKHENQRLANQDKEKREMEREFEYTRFNIKNNTRKIIDDLFEVRNDEAGFEEMVEQVERKAQRMRADIDAD